MELGIFDITDPNHDAQLSDVLGEIHAERTTGIIDRYMDRVDEAEDGCWYWTGASNEGRGVASYGGTRMYAYALFYMLFFNRVPLGDVRHLCGNKVCVNPDHLCPEGYATQNTLDTRFHKYLESFGLKAPFPLALRNWGVDTADGHELYDIWYAATSTEGPRG